MMSGVSGPSPGDGNGRAEVSENGAGVLANLPRTRPQRATARRAAARRSDGPGASANGADSALATKPPAKAKARTARASKPAASSAGQRAKRPAPGPARQVKRAPAAARSRRAAPIVDPAPRQGYECLEERATGAVAPPGGADLVNTAIEAFGELAKAGLSSGERLLRDVLSRLPG
jgi:hypothetical protein